MNKLMKLLLEGRKDSQHMLVSIHPVGDNEGVAILVDGELVGMKMVGDDGATLLEEQAQGLPFFFSHKVPDSLKK